MAFMSRAAHVLQWQTQWATKAQAEVTASKPAIWFPLSTATCGHEGGIASNRCLVCYGEDMT